MARNHNQVIKLYLEYSCEIKSQGLSNFVKNTYYYTRISNETGYKYDVARKIIEKYLRCGKEPDKEKKDKIIPLYTSLRKRQIKLNAAGFLPLSYYVSEIAVKIDYPEELIEPILKKHARYKKHNYREQ